jgi:hypothetical protein
MMQRAQNFLFSKPCLYSAYVDPATGHNPILTTVAGTRKYDIPDVAVSLDGMDRTLRIAMVYDFYSHFEQVNDYRLHPYGHNVEKVQGRRIYWKFTPHPATETDAACLVLPFDPGTYTTRYRYTALLEPMQLTSDAIPLMVTPNDEWAIIDGALGYIEYYDYGRSDRLEKFKEQLAREFWDKYSAIATPNKANGTIARRF